MMHTWAVIERWVNSRVEDLETHSIEKTLTLLGTVHSTLDVPVNVHKLSHS